MARYVDVDKADTEQLDWVQSGYGMCCTLDDFERWLDNLPTADVVEVVRCKDCVFWDNGRCEAPHNGLIREFTFGVDYCSYGERKEIEQNEKH